MIAVVDYRKGNLKSVERGLVAAGGNARITDDARVIAHADAIVLPGVGAFADAAATMEELGQMEVIRKRVEAGVPFLGICLGAHLMFEEGDEGAPEVGEDEDPRRPRGLAILPGVVRKMPRFDAYGHAYKVPHVGWNAVVPFAADTANGRVDAAAFRGTQSSCVDEGLPTEGGFASASPSTSNATETLADCATSPDMFSCPLFDGIKSGEFFYFTHSYVAPDSPATVATTTHSIAFPCAVQYRDNAFGVQFHPEKSSDAGARLLANFVRIAGEIKREGL